MYIRLDPGLIRISIFYTVQLHHCSCSDVQKTRKEGRKWLSSLFSFYLKGQISKRKIANSCQFTDICKIMNIMASG